jgi:hypothetical protein
MTAVLQFLTGFTLGYLYSTFAEAFIHEFISDAPRARVEMWKKRVPLLFAPMIRTNFSHHTIHHCSTYHDDHVTQFRSVEEKAALDAKLSQFPHGREVMGALYGNKFSFWGWVASCSPFIPVVGLAYWGFGAAFAAGAFVTLSFPPFMNNYMHKYTHMSYERATREAPLALRWFVKSPYMRAVTRHHFLHHRYSNRNFNMVLGSDWLRGKVRKPAPRDVDEMLRLGIRID